MNELGFTILNLSPFLIAAGWVYANDMYRNRKASR